MFLRNRKFSVSSDPNIFRPKSSFCIRHSHEVLPPGYVVELGPHYREGAGNISRTKEGLWPTIKLHMDDDERKAVDRTG